MKRTLNAWIAGMVFLVISGMNWAGAGERVNVVKVPDGGAVPDAEVDAKGTIHLAFVKGENAFYASSGDQGKTFSPPLRINSEPGTVHPANMFRGPDLTVGKNGRVQVVWYGNGYQRKLPKEEWGVFYSYLDQGTNSFVSSRNLNRRPSDNFSIAANGRGDVAVIWMAEGVYLTRSENNGEAFRTEKVEIADPCECCASRALVSEDGTLSVAYREKADNLRDMYLLESERGKEPFTKLKVSSTPWKISACPMTGAFISGSAEATVMAWETKGSIFFARMESKDHTPREVAVGARGKWPIALEAADGVLLVTWKSGSTLFWQLFNRDDKYYKREGQLHLSQSSNSHRHAAVKNPDGTFVIID